MKICTMPQHFIDWESVGGYEKFMADYKAATSYSDRRTLIESLPMQTNPEWLATRRGHITASKMKDFLGMDRSGKNPGIGYKKVVKQLVAEEFGWEEAESTWNEKASIKRGLCMERRARELFEKETGIALDNEIGFISTEVNGMPFGCSLDAYMADDSGFTCIAEIKSFELCRLQDELEVLHGADVYEQMQAQMFICDCPRAYKILYSPELDKIFYLKYTRGLDFKKRLLDRVEIAQKYREKMKYNLVTYTDLTDKIMED